MKNFPLSYLEISKSNLISNIRQFKKISNRRVKISVAVKGNAYGHGLKEVTTILDPFVDYFQLNNIEELKVLRKFSKKKVLLLGYVQYKDLNDICKLDCILTVFSIEQIVALGEIVKQSKKNIEIHLPIDAKLGREGFLLDEIPKVIEEIRKHKNLKLTGIYAHFANIEDTNNFTHAQKQIKDFEKAKKIFNDFGYKKLNTHISATSGLLVYEKNKKLNSLIRLGIGVYGLWPSEHIKFLYKNKIELKPVITWKTKVAQVKTLSAGSTIGYGLTYTTFKNIKIAVIPQGYADGLDRGLSNKGEVLIQGKRCKILGRVAMNMCVVDVSHLENILQEEEVVILGKQGGEEITAEEIANKVDTINYEIVTRISSFLPRIII